MEEVILSEYTHHTDNLWIHRFGQNTSSGCDVIHKFIQTGSFHFFTFKIWYGVHKIKHNTTLLQFLYEQFLLFSRNSVWNTNSKSMYFYYYYYYLLSSTIMTYKFYHLWNSNSLYLTINLINKVALWTPDFWCWRLTNTTILWDQVIQIQLQTMYHPDIAIHLSLCLLSWM